MRIIFTAILAAALLASGAAGAQEMQAAPKCTELVAPPPALAGWTSKQDVSSASKADGLPRAALTIDRGATVALHPTREVSYVAQPDKPGGSVASGGLLSVSIESCSYFQSEQFGVHSTTLESLRYQRFCAAAAVANVSNSSGLAYLAVSEDPWRRRTGSDRVCHVFLQRTER